MATNHRARIERLERLYARNGGNAGSAPLIVAMSRFSAPDEAFSGYTVNGEFFERESSETIDDTKRRVADLVSRRGGSTFYFLKPVLRRPQQYVEELPE